MAAYLLGTDVGTTGTKTLLFREDGTLLAHAYRGYDLKTPGVGMSEQEAGDWWRTVVETVREVCAAIPDPENVAAISLSLQGGTMVPVDSAMQPLRPAIVWNDTRCGKQQEEFLAEGMTKADAYRTCGWNLGVSLPVLSTRWIRDNEPEVFAKTAMILTVPDYISYKMTGICAVDLSDAGINQFCNIRTGRYDEAMMRFAGVREDMLPRLVHTGEVIGLLTPQAAKELGLTEKTVLIAGAHDQYAVAAGAGALKDGDVVIGSGTAWVVTGISDAPHFETGLAQSVAAAPGMWGSIFSLSNGGVCLEWLRKNLTKAEDGQLLSFDRINEECGVRRAAEDGLFFFPPLGIAGSGKRFRKGYYTGLDLSHDRFDLARAVMECTVFQTAWMMESFGSAGAGKPLRLAGGASRSPVWTKLIADITGRPVLIPKVADLACVGAAVIAGWGCGLFDSIGKGYERLAVDATLTEPELERTSVYRDAFALYKKTAESLSAVQDL